MKAPGPVGGVVILAAGRSRRFGSDKRAHRLGDGRTLLEHSIDRYGGAFARCIVVIRPDDPAPAGGAPEGTVFVPAAEADLGMGHSLASGARAAQDWDYLFVALADMPWVRPATLARLRSAMERLSDGAAIILQPVVDGRPGHPVGFSRAFFSALQQLRGDAGARAIVRANPAAIVPLRVDDPGILRDLDTPEQAEAD